MLMSLSIFEINFQGPGIVSNFQDFQANVLDFTHIFYGLTNKD